MGPPTAMGMTAGVCPGDCTAPLVEALMWQPRVSFWTAFFWWVSAFWFGWIVGIVFYG